MAGRAVAVKAEFRGFIFCLINVYAPNQGPDKLALFQKLSAFIKQCSQDEVLVMGGDWNCTTDFTLDRTGSPTYSLLGAEVAVVDVWRVKHPSDRQYTWMKMVDGRVSAARLDRIYMSHSHSNRLLNSHIFPVTSYWHFNVKLLQDADFCKKIEVFWEIWRGRKGELEFLSQWWEVGKAHIRVFCQQYTSHSTTLIRRTIQQLEQDIRDMEDRVHTPQHRHTHCTKRNRS